MRKKIVLMTTIYLLLALLLVPAASAGPAKPTDNAKVQSWFHCKLCEAFTEVIGVAAAAGIIAADPEGSAAATAMEAVYGGMHDKYGGGMDISEFMSRTKSFADPLSTAEFILAYPRFCCCLFGKCSCSGNCNCN